MQKAWAFFCFLWMKHVVFISLSFNFRFCSKYFIKTFKIGSDFFFWILSSSWVMTTKFFILSNPLEKKHGIIKCSFKKTIVCCSRSSQNSMNIFLCGVKFDTTWLCFNYVSNHFLRYGIFKPPKEAKSSKRPRKGFCDVEEAVDEFYESDVFSRTNPIIIQFHSQKG